MLGARTPGGEMALGMREGIAKTRRGTRLAMALFVTTMPAIPILTTAVLARDAGPPRVVVAIQVDRGGKDGVKPGQVLTYRIASGNRGDAAARNVAVINPVPVGTTYVPNSAAGKGTKLFFSIDGGQSYATWPVRIRDAKTRRERKASPEQITHVKWALQRPLPPGGEVAVSYQVRVK